jgi:RNA-directed DNA polymerase
VDAAKAEVFPFRISTLRDLCDLIKVSSGEVGYVLSRLERFYSKDLIPKPCGKARVLHKPRGRLRLIQSRIKSAILDRVSPLPFVHGGIKKRSILSNAAPHTGKDAVLAVDIKDCFPSIGPCRVSRVFEALGISGEATLILTKLTTFDYQLPQGTCTSPAIANLALRTIDFRLNALSRQHRFCYTRFVDDIFISGSIRLAKFVGLVHRIFESEGFSLKVKKELMLQNEPQLVTKLVVNRKPNVPKQRKAAIRREAVEEFQYGRGKLSPSTYGKLTWVKSVNREIGDRLLRRFPIASGHGQ